MRSPLPLKCYPIALRRSVRQGEYVENSMYWHDLWANVSRSDFHGRIQIWSVPRQFWQRCNKWTQLGRWAMFRFRMHEGELQWSTLAVDLPKMMNLHEQNIQKLLEIWPQSRVPEDMEYRIETWTLSGLHETNKLGSSLGESACASVRDGQGLKMFGAKAVPNWQGRTNQSLATEGLLNLQSLGLHSFGFGMDVFYWGVLLNPEQLTLVSKLWDFCMKIAVDGDTPNFPQKSGTPWFS